MADLKEKPVWEEGIYQLEEDDPVQAGEDGIDNRQAKQLANRTQWLKGKIESQSEMLAEHASAVAEISDPDSGLDSKAPLKSPGFSGIPTVPTPSGNEPLQIVNTQYLADTLADGLLKFAQSNPESVERIKELLSAQRTDDKFAAVTGLVKALSDRINAARAQDVEMWPAQAVTDKNGRIAYGVTPQGDFYRPAATDCNSGTFPGWAVTDRRSRLMFGFDAPRGEMLLPGGSIGMNRNVSWAVGDKNGRTAVSLLPDGAVRFSGGVCDDSGIVWLEGGDVYRQRGGRTERITRRGDVAACRAHGQAIRYVAPRRGVFLTYEWRDGKTRQVFCSDANETDGFIVTGQSLAEGGANAAMSRRPAVAGKAYMTDTGPVPNPARGAGVRAVELREQVYETICSSFAARDAAANPKKIMMIGAAQGGMVYERLKKGGSSGVYEKIVKQMRVLLNCPLKPVYRALFVIHGEADGNTGNRRYDLDLAQWLEDFTGDIRTLTGQEDDPVMLTCQTSSVGGYKKTPATRHEFTTPFLQLKASAEHPRIFLVCPKYQFDYKDYAHILGKDTGYLGEYYAKVKKAVVDEGSDWLGLRPKRLVKTDARTVEIEFHVPSPPLVFDEKAVTNPGDYGFFLQNSGGVRIAAVELDAGHNTVRITADGDIPDGACVSYAFDNGTPGKSGRTQGARGNLRDSAPEVSADGKFHLYNWAFAFSLPVNQE